MKIFSKNTIPAWIVAGLAVAVAGTQYGAAQSTDIRPQLPKNMHCAVARDFGNMRFAAILGPGGSMGDWLLMANVNTKPLARGSEFTPMSLEVKLTPTTCRPEDVELLHK